jgi:hypothetical protein
MAVAAINSDGGYVVLVTEWNRLRPRDVLKSNVRRALNLDACPKNSAN